MNYRSTKAAEEKNFVESIKRSQKLIVRLVQSYNTHIENFYKGVDEEKIKRIYSKLESLGDNPLSSLYKGKINSFARTERARIALIDYKTAKLLWFNKLDSQRRYKETDFPEISYIYKELDQGKVHSRFSWVEQSNKFKLFVRKATPDRKYVWRIILPVYRDKTFDNLVLFLKKTQEFDPLIEKTGMYSYFKQVRHGIDYLKLPNNVDYLATKKNCSNLNNCSYWKKLKKASRHQNTNSYITYIGLKFSNKILKQKLENILNNLYNMLAVSLVFSVLLGFILSDFFSRSLQKILLVIRKISKDMDVDCGFPDTNIDEVNELSLAFKKLLNRFRDKKEQVRSLARKNLYVADKERRDISRDLHDSVGQLLVAANFKIHSKEYEQAEKNISAASDELRAIYDELEPRSLEKMDLNKAVEWYFLKFFPKDFLYDINVVEADSFETSIRVQVYRIIQEAIANIRKHAKDCTYISITLERYIDVYCLKIKNNSLELIPRKEKCYGRGLENIALRAETFGGKLQINQSDKSFEISIIFKDSFK